MAICETYRISHSHFLGGPPVWTQLDRDKAVWHVAWKQALCQQCGTHPDEWDPDKGGDRTAYVAVTVRCTGCASLEQHREALESDRKQQGLRGVRAELRRPAVTIPVEGGLGDDRRKGQ